MIPEVISKTKQKFIGITYYLCGSYLQRDGIRLHRVVYAHHNGEIPSGMDVHHIDEDKTNNAISNLELISHDSHTYHHHIGHRRGMPENATEKARIWHSSDEGLKWHKMQYQRTKEFINATLTLSCSACHKTFTSTNRGNNKFCSAKCCAKHRRESGIDDVQRECLYCGSYFMINKYKKTLNCSRKCAQQHNKKAQ